MSQIKVKYLEVVRQISDSVGVVQMKVNNIEHPDTLFSS